MSYVIVAIVISLFGYLLLSNPVLGDRLAIILFWFFMFIRVRFVDKNSL